MSRYTYEELEERVKEMNKGGLGLSEQYGMIFILNDNGQILLRLDELLKNDKEN